MSNSQIVQELKDHAGNLTEELRTRVNFSDIKQVYSGCGLPVANGWGRLITNLKNYDDIEIESKLEKLKLQLGKFLRSYILYSDKSISIYNDYKFINEAYNNLDKSVIDNPEELSFESHNAFGDLEFFIYKTTRTFFERVAVDMNSLDEFNQGEYQQIFAIKSINRECYDSIIFNKAKGYIILSIDRATLSDSGIIQKAHSKLVRKINESVRGVSSEAHFKDSGNNLFPAIEKFYEDTTGEVTSLSFLTLSGTSHNEKLHKTCSDVRQAVYHIAGSSATTIEPYRISIRYSFDNHNPEIFLMGSFKSINTRAARQLFIAQIQNAKTRKAFEFCIDKIIKFIQR